MVTPVELREESRHYREESIRAACPKLKQVLARQAFDLAQLAEKLQYEAAALDWSETFSIGHSETDFQHRRLIDGVNELCAAHGLENNPKRLAAAWQTIHQTTEEHVQQENLLLLELTSGAYRSRQNRAQSPTFLRALAKISIDEHFASHDAELSRLESIAAGRADAVCPSVKAWFLDHVIKHDAGLKAIFQALS